MRRACPQPDRERQHEKKKYPFICSRFRRRVVSGLGRHAAALAHGRRRADAAYRRRSGFERLDQNRPRWHGGAGYAAQRDGPGRAHRAGHAGGRGAGRAAGPNAHGPVGAGQHLWQRVDVCWRTAVPPQRRRAGSGHHGGENGRMGGGQDSPRAGRRGHGRVVQCGRRLGACALGRSHSTRAVDVCGSGEVWRCASRCQGASGCKGCFIKRRRQNRQLWRAGCSRC